MPTVAEVLRSGAPWCLDCLVKQTTRRADSVLHELDALSMQIAEGRCGSCSESGPVFAG